MKKSIMSCLAMILGMAVLILPASALEVAALGTLGNGIFDTARTTSLGSTGAAFSENIQFWSSLSAKETFSDDISFSASFERDPILRNRIYTRLGFDAGFAKIDVGPFFGPFNNSSSILTSGLSTSLRMEFIGFLFGSFRADSTIGAGIAAPGDYVQERSEISLGFWMPNVITTFRVASDAFTEKKSAAMVVEDVRSRYELVADIYKKNVPYTAHVVMGYQSLKRSYIGNASTDIDELGSLLLGLDLSAQVTDNLKLMVGGELPMYSWGIGNMRSPAASLVLYEVRTGVTWTIPKAEN
jgi:hypothetical protein